MVTYKHSFAKAWLAYLGNEIYINGKNFFKMDLDRLHDKFEIKPLKTRIVIGQDLLDEKDLAEVGKISYQNMKDKLGLAIYRVSTSKRLKGWNKSQKYIYYIAEKREGKIPVPEGTIRRRNSEGKCIIRWDKLNKCVQGVGDDFGTPEGIYGNGDVTPWISYGTVKKKRVPINVLARHNSYDEISDLLHKKWKGERIVKRQTMAIPELPVGITEEGDLLCIPYDKNYVPKIVMVGKTGAGKCQPKGSKVLMENNEYKSIEDVKIGDKVISPQDDGRIELATVVDVDSYYSEKNYAIVDESGKQLYRCSALHLLPILNDNGYMVNDSAFHLANIGKQYLSYVLTKDDKLQDKCIKVVPFNPCDVYGITIDSQSQYYVTDNNMVTHNSWTLNSILGRAFYIYQDKCVLLNDSLNQFYDLSLPATSQTVINELYRVGNEPRHLPTINLYMSCSRLKKQYIKYINEQTGFRLVIALRDFLRSYKYFTKGILKWDLGKPEKYLRNEIITAMEDCATADEVKRLLYAMIPNAADDKGAQAMIFKWESAFQSIFSARFTSNLFKDEESTAAYWTLKMSDGEKYTGHPAIISAYAGLLPVVNNSLAKEYPIAPKQLADTIRKIPRWQMEMDAIKRKKRIWVVIDELKDLLGKKGSDVYDALDYLFSQGRFPMIGFIGNLQEYTKMSMSMRNNTSHLVVFDLKSKAERKLIADDYDCKEQMDNIGDLKQYQCYFITTERMVIYTKDNIRKVKEAGKGGLWKCKILPPITVHKKPSD